ncbi:MAG: hypothetical protein ACRC7O_10195 [Fimbriiglobus sp.]
MRNWPDRLGRWVEATLVALPGKWLALIAVTVLSVAAIPLLIFQRPDPGAGRDWYGLLLGALGFWYTLSQIYQTKLAAEAARESANEASERAAINAYRSRVERAKFYVESAETMVDAMLWKQAVNHLREACKELRRIQFERKQVDGRWNQFAQGFTTLADYFRDFGVERKKLKDFPPDWAPLRNAVLNELASESVIEFQQVPS